VPPDEWRFVSAPHGKPQTIQGVPSFNLSHTRGVVACVVAQSMAVGIDVERTDRRTDTGSIAERFFSPAEAAELRATPDDTRTRFVEIWTLKEAFVKAIGLGLSQPLDAFSFSLDGSMIRFTAPPACCSTEWRFGLYAPYPDTRVAVAAHSPDCAVQWRARLYPEGVTIEPIGTSSG
jgi:4'-phosphopantetheinyl transferase